MEPDTTSKVALPSPAAKSRVSVEEAIATRRSVRDFAERPVTLGELGQLLWAAQGVTSSDGGRTAPSAGALYPLEVYLVVGDVAGLDVGVYRYHPHGHFLTSHLPGDIRDHVARSALHQNWLADAAAVVVIAAAYERTRQKYGPRTERYVHMEVGHVAQNIYLQAQSLGLGTVMVGAFQDREVQTALRLPAGEAPLALMPVGHPD
jgi:SagB-type dehydrogenase family enzyme